MTTTTTETAGTSRGSGQNDTAFVHAPWQRVHHHVMNELILLSVELLDGGFAPVPALHGAAVHN